MTPIKKCRLNAGMTLTETAKALRVGEDTYSNWETGQKTMPSTRTKSLTKIFGCSCDDILGKKKPFDWLGGKGLDKDSTFYGDVAIHFNSGTNLLVPVTEQNRVTVMRFFDSSLSLVRFDSLDNRIIFVRVDAIADIYLSSESYDTYGPDKETYPPRNIFEPDNDTWVDIENYSLNHEIDDLSEDFPDIHQLFERLREENNHDEISRIETLAQDVTWQLNSGKIRRQAILDNKMASDLITDLMDEHDEIGAIILGEDGYYDRSVVLPLASIEYISFPKHKYELGRLDELCEQIDG